MIASFVFHQINTAKIFTPFKEFVYLDISILCSLTRYQLQFLRWFSIKSFYFFPLDSFLQCKYKLFLIVVNLCLQQNTYPGTKRLSPSVAAIAEWWLAISFYKYWRINLPCQLNNFWQRTWIQAIMSLCRYWFITLCQLWNTSLPVSQLFVINFDLLVFLLLKKNMKKLNEKSQN